MKRGVWKWGPTGEYFPCETEMKTIQSDDGTWVYEYSELPGLIRMRNGTKSFDIIEQTPFNLTPKGPHRNLVRQIIDQMGIEVKSKQVWGKESRYTNLFGRFSALECGRYVSEYLPENVPRHVPDNVPKKPVNS